MPTDVHSKDGTLGINYDSKIKINPLGSDANEFFGNFVNTFGVHNGNILMCFQPESGIIIPNYGIRTNDIKIPLKDFNKLEIDKLVIGSSQISDNPNWKISLEGSKIKVSQKILDLLVFQIIDTLTSLNLQTTFNKDSNCLETKNLRSSEIDSVFKNLPCLDFRIKKENAEILVFAEKYFSKFTFESTKLCLLVESSDENQLGIQFLIGKALGYDINKRSFYLSNSTCDNFFLESEKASIIQNTKPKVSKAEDKGTNLLKKFHFLLKQW